VPERETVCALEADTPHRLTKQFVPLPPTELGQEILKNGQAAAVRSVSTEAAVRFHRYRKGPFFSDDIANGPLFLTTRFRFASFSDAKLCTLLGGEIFGQIRTRELRDSAQFVQTARFAFSPLTRSLSHVCDGIAQHHEFSKVGSNPVRVAIRLALIKGLAHDCP